MGRVGVHALRVIAIPIAASIAVPIAVIIA